MAPIFSKYATFRWTTQQLCHWQDCCVVHLNVNAVQLFVLCESRDCILYCKEFQTVDMECFFWQRPLPSYLHTHTTGLHHFREASFQILLGFLIVSNVFHWKLLNSLFTIWTLLETFCPDLFSCCMACSFSGQRLVVVVNNKTAVELEVTLNCGRGILTNSFATSKMDISWSWEVVFQMVNTFWTLSFVSFNVMFFEYIRSPRNSGNLLWLGFNINTRWLFSEYRSQAYAYIQGKCRIVVFFFNALIEWFIM